MRWKSHVRFGGRAEETDRLKGRHRASTRSNHTCAALLVAQGAHQLTIMRRLGHSSITVTLDTYGHLFPELEEDLTDRLDAVARDAAGSRLGHAGARRDTAVPDA